MNIGAFQAPSSPSQSIPRDDRPFVAWMDHVPDVPPPTPHAPVVPPEVPPELPPEINDPPVPDEQPPVQEPPPIPGQIVALRVL